MTDRLPRDAEPEERWWFATSAATRCVSPDLLWARRAGTVPLDIAHRVDEHVSTCAACRALLDALMALGEEAGPTRAEEQRISRSIKIARPRAMWHPAWFAAAAMILLAFGLALLVARPDDGLPPVVRVSADRELTGDGFALRLEKPGVDLPPDALVLRGEDKVPYVSELEAALVPWRRNDFDAAAAAFRRLTSRFPARPHGFFYEGVSLLMSGRAADAIRPLQRARLLAGDDPALRDASTWYLAVSLERSGDRAAAIQALADLCSSGTTRRDDGCRGLAGLRPPLGASGAREWGRTSVRGDIVGGGADDIGGRSAGAGTVPVQ